MPSLRLYYPSFKWNKVTALRQSYGYSGIANDSIWTPIRSIRSHYYISTQLDNVPDNIHSYDLKKRILLVCENPSIYTPSNSLFELYQLIISPFHPPISFKGDWIKAQPAIPWFYGLVFDTTKGLTHVPIATSCELGDLSTSPWPKKDKLLSIVVSKKAYLPGQSWRIEVANSIKNLMGNAVDIYGFGYKPIANKRQAMDRYLYTLVIENLEHDHYWTEKLADAFLARCMPIYSGCKNAELYFGMDLPRIPFCSDPELAALSVIRLISLGKHYNSKYIERARNKILFGYNMLYYIPRIISGGSSIIHD